jgi:D-arabinose 1-dehydrogenase-like Zn-dependent alcohol dehydrogenase
MKVVALSKLRSAITLGLVLWCGGAGCMIVSYAHGAAMSENVAASSESTAWGETSGSMGAHKCCKARHASERRLASSTKNVSSSYSFADLEELAELPNSSNAMNCCPLTSGTFVVNGRQRVSNDDASVLLGPEAASVTTRFTATSLALPLRLPNQNQTYLRGCVFLI